MGEILVTHKGSLKSKQLGQQQSSKRKVGREPNASFHLKQKDNKHKCQGGTVPQQQLYGLYLQVHREESFSLCGFTAGVGVREGGAGCGVRGDDSVNKMRTPRAEDLTLNL